MKKITRRKALLIGGVTTIAAISLPSCCFIREILNVPCDPIKQWKKEGSKWWTDQMKQREAERQKDIIDGKRADVKLPIPYLDIDRIAGPHNHPIYQVRSFHLNEWNDLYVMVRNLGNAPTWTCIIEAYETPTFPYELPFSRFIFNDRVITTLIPGESKEVKLKFRVTKEIDGGCGLRCYDPICDPGYLTFGQYDRFVSGFGWAEWTYQ